MGGRNQKARLMALLTTLRGDDGSRVLKRWTGNVKASGACEPTLVRTAVQHTIAASNVGQPQCASGRCYLSWHSPLLIVIFNGYMRPSWLAVTICRTPAAHGGGF